MAGGLAALVAVSGCRTPAALKAPRPVPRPAPAAATVLPPAMPVPASDEPERYRIHAGDVLSLQVTGEEESSGEFKVAPDGTIVHPLIGRMAVADMTVTGLESRLTTILARDYLVNPRVFLQVKSSSVRRVILFGEVKTPGVYDLPVGDRFTLLQLIARAGGFSEIAAADRVRVVRRTGGAERTFRVNVTALLKGEGGETDLELQPNDVITIPQTVF